MADVCGESDQSVEELVQLRTTVESWTKTALDALSAFKRKTGSFWKDSKPIKAGQKEPPHITTSARAYMALVQADRRRDTSKGKKTPIWASSLREFMAIKAIGRRERHFNEVKPKKKKDKDGYRDKYEVNTFDIAHLATFYQAAKYLDRFYGEKVDVDIFFEAPDKSLKPDFKFRKGESAPKHSRRETGNAFSEMSAKQAIVQRLREALAEAAKFDQPSIGFPGEVCFEEDRPESRHYFATLHALRALHLLEGQPAGGEAAENGVEAPKVERVPEWPERFECLEKVVAGARSFAIEQCHYFERGITHRQDPVRLAFAGSIYAIYGEHIDKDLCMAIVEALAAAQQQNGSWPATHPVFRQNNVPWHIASHEVALCLTWLYFQPRVPDAARPLLIDMMRKYLLSAVIPTFLRVQSGESLVGKDEGDEKKPERLDGWQDDHTVSPDTTLGWATAVVCHFLASFEQVLDDWINRRVIDVLGLGPVTKGYLIDDTASTPSRRWSRDDRNVSWVWPDLPPRAWTYTQDRSADQQASLAEEWTDPTLDLAICASLADKVLQPIAGHPSEQPRPNRCAGLMPGKPGTRKTSLVKATASLLGWPMVAVPASSIFEHGFDKMEARANEVFGLLNHLRHCVIFFDEFEEFFVARPHGTDGAPCDASGDSSEPDPGDQSDADLPLKEVAYGSRTIAAFTTSAMLPRLQDLHDRGWCLIFLATNHSKRIDDAIKREGRFDFKITVEHPEIDRLIQFLQLPLSRRTRESIGFADPPTARQAQVIGIVREALEKIQLEIPPKAESKDKQLRFTAVEGQLRELAATHEVANDPSANEQMKAAFDKLKPEMGEEAPKEPPELTDL